MHHKKANDGKVISGDWHATRQRARENAFSPEEFSEIERTEYNLDSDDRLSPAGITGQDNPASYDGSAAVGIDPPERVPLGEDETR